MEALPSGRAVQLGLLDLSADLSVPEIYSGTDFTLYLHIKNPFGRPVWIRSVELSLPTQLSWKATIQKQDHERSAQQIEARERQIKARSEEITKLEQQRRVLTDDQNQRRDELFETIAKLEAANRRDQELQASVSGATVVSVADNSTIHVEAMRAERFYFSAGAGSSIHLVDLRSAAEAERVPLTGSLPKGAALEPGCTDVWTIRLGSGHSPFFIPAAYRLHLTAIYGLNSPQDDRGNTDDTDDTPQPVTDGAVEQLFANTTAVTVAVKAALWSVILGGVIGGLIGSIARSLQAAKTLSALFSGHLGGALGALFLAVILSATGIIFSARKSDVQSFVTVEDFWGGLLIGFLIGYSGTAAFTSLTGVHS